MRRLIFAGAIALVATVGLTAPAITRTRSENFKFNYDSAYSHKGLSRPYTGPTTTGQSYGTGVAIDPSDPSQKVYTLVEVNPNIGVGGPRGAFPASSRTIPPSSTPAIYGPPGAVLHRAPHQRRRDRHHLWAPTATSAPSRTAATAAINSPVCASIPAPPTSSSSGRK